MRKLLSIIFISILFSVFGKSSYAASLTLSPTVDTYINSASPNSSYSNSQNLVSSWSQNNGTQSIPLFKFSLAQLPANATINSATLTLWQNNSANENVIFMVVTAPTSSWNNNVTWANKPFNQGAYAQTSLDWDLTFKTWDMKSIVKAWYAGTIPNYGFYLKPPGLGADYNRTFSSNEDPQANRRPKLAIDYTVVNNNAAAPNIDFRITPIVVNLGDVNFALTISDVKSVGDFGSATITWKTSKKSNSYVYYGNAQDGINRFDKQTGQNDSTTSHSVTINNLTPANKYSFKVMSEDVGGDPVFGAISTFTTLSEPSGDAYGTEVSSALSPTPTSSSQNPIEKIGEKVENKVAEYVIKSSTVSASAENGSGTSGKSQNLTSNNPLVKFTEWAGTNRIAGIIMIILGVLSLIGALIIFETGRRVHRHIRKVVRKKRGGKK